MTSERLAEIEAEIARLNSEVAPVRSEIILTHQRLDDLTRRIRPTESRIRELADERLRIKDAARWTAQSALVAEAWAAYVAGERTTIVLAGPEGPRMDVDVVPAHRVGAWAVHATIGELPGSEIAWTVTHGPSGLAAYRGRTRIDALGLATQLHAVAPELPTDTATGRPSGSGAAAETIRAHERAMEVAR